MLFCESINSGFRDYPYIAPETTTIEVNTKSLISISTMGENARMDSDVLTKEENDAWDIWE